MPTTIFYFNPMEVKQSTLKMIKHYHSIKSFDPSQPTHRMAQRKVLNCTMLIIVPWKIFDTWKPLWRKLISSEALFSVDMEKSSVEIKQRNNKNRYRSTIESIQIGIAEKYGAIGVILYNDPLDSAPNYTLPGSTYPNTVYMPEMGVQRGSALLLSGDPLTKHYPAKGFHFHVLFFH